MESKNLLQDPTSGSRISYGLKEKMSGRAGALKLNGRIASFLLGVACLIIGLIVAEVLGLGRASMQTRLTQVMANQTISSHTWTNGPIERANGFKTLIAQFTWANGYQMKNNNNYAVAWYNDASGKEQVGQTQFGQGTVPYQNQALQVLAPYYQIQVMNTDTVSHDVNAWAYLMSN